MDEKSLSHTSWNCKYHIVLVPKYRRKVIYGKLRKDIGKILRTLFTRILVPMRSTQKSFVVLHRLYAARGEIVKSWAISSTR